MLFRRKLVFAAALVLVLALATVFGALAEDYHVKTDGQDIASYDGKSWTEAWQTVEYALGKATSGDVIHVRAGVYSLSATGEAFPISVDSSHGGITLLGAGMGMTILDAEGSNSNKRRVMNLIGVDGFKLEGFTITGGYVASDSGYNDWAVANGGGLYCYECANLLIEDCEITENYAKGSFASQDGEGHYNWYGQYGAGTWQSARAGGGGIYLRQCKSGNSPTVTIDSCLIHHNETGMGGGGICSNYGPAIIRHTCIHSNKACQGSGVYWFDYVVSGDKIEHILFNDLIVLNELRTRAYSGHEDGWTADQGGGVYMSSWGVGQKFRLYNVTVADNDGYEVYMSHNCKNINIKGANNIFWPDDDNKGFHDDGFNGTADMIYSDIWWKDGEAYPGQGGTSSSHNIFGDPLFEHYGEYEVVCQRYFLDRPDSPAIDTGTSDDTKTYSPADIMDPNPFTTDVSGKYDGKDKDEMDMGYHSMTHGSSYIELVSFTATALPAKVLLRWETGAEIDNAGFLLYRSEAGGKSYGCISGLIAAQGSASSGASYTFVDKDVSGTVYNYYLVDIDTSGNWTPHGPVSARLPMGLKLIELPTGNCQLATVR